MTPQLTTHPERTSTQPRRRRAAGAAAIAAAALFAPSVSAADARVPAHAPGASRPVEQRLQAIMERAVKAPGSAFPGVSLYVRRDGHGAWTGAAGRADIRTGRPMRPTDRVRAGSILKPFVATATLQLVEEGRFGLDDPLPTVLPPRLLARFPEAGQITVRMLLDHTSGIAEYADENFEREVAAQPQRRWRAGELLDRSAALPRTAAPGTGFFYSNANYNLLGLVLEQATGQSWRAVVRARVIDRLHLTHTSLPQPGRLPRGRDIAHGYQEVDGVRYDFTDVDSSMAGAAGGNALLTTASDLARFLHGLGGRLSKLHVPASRPAHRPDRHHEQHRRPVGRALPGPEGLARRRFVTTAIAKTAPCPDRGRLRNGRSPRCRFPCSSCCETRCRRRRH